LPFCGRKIIGAETGVLVFNPGQSLQTVMFETLIAPDSARARPSPGAAPDEVILFVDSREFTPKEVRYEAAPEQFFDCGMRDVAAAGDGCTPGFSIRLAVACVALIGAQH